MDKEARKTSQSLFLQGRNSDAEKIVYRVFIKCGYRGRNPFFFREGILTDASTLFRLPSAKRIRVAIPFSSGKEF